MDVSRIKCTDCDNMVLLQTARDNHGLCAQCVKLPASIRTQRKTFQAGLKEGSVFKPDTDELASAFLPAELAVSTQWMPEPEYHSGDLAAISKKLTAPGKWIHLSKIRVWWSPASVLQFYLRRVYAYTDQNLRIQVSDELHISQGCPCCGVGTGWYPSRYHFPREKAFVLFAVLLRLTTDCAPNVQWLQSGDISYTSKGVG